MDAIFGFFGSIFGYVLDFFYTLIPNYGIALILFTLFTKIILFPLSIHQQKSVAMQARMTVKQNELKAKHGTDKNRYNEELMKLYEKEGFSPTSGCMPMLIQLPIMLGLFYAVSSPLTNVLHIAAANFNQSSLKETLTKWLTDIAKVGNYPQMQVIEHFNVLKDNLASVLTGNDIARIGEFAKGFNFFGLDLLATPSFSSALIIIPLLCFLTGVGSVLFSTMLQGRKLGIGSLVTAVMMSSITTMFSLAVPAAVGMYWVFSNIFGFGQTYILSKFYNAQQMCALEESARISRRDQEEQIQLEKAKKLPKVYVPAPQKPASAPKNAQKNTGNKKKR